MVTRIPGHTYSIMKITLTILECQEFKYTMHNADQYSQSQEVGIGLQQCCLHSIAMGRSCDSHVIVIKIMHSP